MKINLFHKYKLPLGPIEYIYLFLAISQFGKVQIYIYILHYFFLNLTDF
jgi:hypothetical protein